MNSGKSTINNKREIERLVVEMTDRCNNNCIYCYQQRGKFSSANIKEIIKKIIDFRRRGLKYIEFSGGEPTLSPHLPGLIALARKEGYENITLLTNGRKLSYKYYCDELISSGLKTIIFSIPIHIASLYSKITRTNKSSFMQVIDALNNIKSYKDLEVGLTTVIHKYNYRYLSEIIKTFIAWKSNFITLTYMLPFGFKPHIGSKNGPFRYIPPYSDVSPYIKNALVQYGEKVKICIEGIPYCLLKGYEKFILNEVFANDCYVINPQGEIQRRLEALELISAKKKKCIKCSYDRRCVGFFINYSKQYGLNYKISDWEKQNVALDIQSGPCDYKCIFCTRQIEGKPYYKLDKEKYKAEVDFDKLKLFFNSSKVSDSLDIWGRERVDQFSKIKDILKLARLSGFKEIRLWSSGLRYGNPKMVENLIRWGVTKFEIPIYGHNAKIHDGITRQAGTFKRLMVGLKTLTKVNDVEIGLHAVVLKQNIVALPELADLLASKSKNIKFSIWWYYPDTRLNYRGTDIYMKYCPSYSDILNSFSRYKNNPLKINVKSAFLPLCIVRKLREYLIRLEPIEICPVRLLVFNNSNSYYDFLPGRGEFNSIYPDKCQTCSVRYKCTGVFKDYLDIYGDRELMPILKKKHKSIMGGYK